MPDADLLELARSAYRAYETSDRTILDDLIAEDFELWSPQDDGLDRATYFERCWPNAETTAAFRFVRLAEVPPGEVLVTYEAERADGTAFRNTEILTFADGKMVKTEVYFGWNLP